MRGRVQVGCGNDRQLPQYTSRSAPSTSEAEPRLNTPITQDPSKPARASGTANRLLSDGTFNYACDGEGNMLSETEIATGKVRVYTWDWRNRLTRVVVDSCMTLTLRGFGRPPQA